MGTAAKVALGVLLGGALLLATVVGVAFALGFLPPPLSEVEYEDRMQTLLAQANAETGQDNQEIQPSKSRQRAIRGFRAQAGTLEHVIQEFEEISPPREVADEHEQLVATYRRARDVLERAADEPDWIASDSGQGALDTAMDAASAAENRIRGEGYDIGTPYF